MDAASDPSIHTVVIMSSAQISKTEILLNVIGYHVDQDPAPILMLQPTLDMGEAFSKDRLATMIRDTECLRTKFPDPRSRDSGNTLLHKKFPGGHVTIAGSNSPASLASRPVRIVLCDEIDRYPPSAGTEGDPVNLARKRSATFWNRLMVLTSTPTVKGVSRIERAYEASDQRYVWVPCPHCDVYQRLVWANVQWHGDDPGTAVYACEACGAAIGEGDKQRMLRRYQWRAAGESRGVAGFHLSELYSPWRTWAEVAADFLEAKGSRETLKVWVNTSLGETWEEEGDQVDAGHLWVRREHYKVAVQDDCLLLVAAVDVQDDRLEVAVWGYGEGEQCWAIDHVAYDGDPGREELWNRVRDYLTQSFDADGAVLKIAACGLDTGGHYTQQAYRFAKSVPIVRAMKGQGGPGVPLVRRPSRNNSERVALYSVGVDCAKELLYGRLRVADPGPGYIHFPVSEWCDREFIDQMTAEKRVPKIVNGRPSSVWVKTRRRNEAMDLWILGYAVLTLLHPVWPALKRRRELPSSEPPKAAGPKPRGNDWLQPRGDSWFRR